MAQWIKYVGFQNGQFDFSNSVWFLILLYLLLPIIFYTILANITYLWRKRSNRQKGLIIKDVNEVVIVVLGDLGHSPRTTNHAKSFLRMGYYVQLCGYIESDLPAFLYGNDDLSVNEIKPIKNDLNLSYPIFVFLKVVMQVINLIRLFNLVIDDATRYVMIQNPPSLPVLAVVCFLKWLLFPHVRIVIDWHNLNYTILNMKFKNERHPMIRLMKYYEMTLSKKFAWLNLTVTDEMKDFLIDEFKLDKKKVMTLYDRPSEKFVPLTSDKERTHVVKNIPQVFKGLGFTKSDKLIVTSTSFTEDEDFHILVKSLIELDEKLSKSNKTSKVLVVVTGKGPLQQEFKKLVESHTWSKQLIIKNVWLPSEFYPQLLKLADIGISLHYSSSGLDLPMKIVDLFGCGIPVISLNFQSIGELVKDNVNGLIMKDNSSSTEMCNKLYEVLFEDHNKLAKLKEGALEESKVRWDDEWDGKLFRKFELD